MGVENLQTNEENAKWKASTTSDEAPTIPDLSVIDGGEAGQSDEVSVVEGEGISVDKIHEEARTQELEAASDTEATESAEQAAILKQAVESDKVFETTNPDLADALAPIPEDASISDLRSLRSDVSGQMVQLQMKSQGIDLSARKGSELIPPLDGPVAPEHQKTYAALAARKAELDDRISQAGSSVKERARPRGQAAVHEIPDPPKKSFGGKVKDFLGRN